MKKNKKTSLLARFDRPEVKQGIIAIRRHFEGQAIQLSILAAAAFGR